MDVRQCPLDVFWGDCGSALKMITLQCTGLQHRVTRGGQTVQNLDFQTNRLSSVRTANTSNIYQRFLKQHSFLSVCCVDDLGRQCKSVNVPEGTVSPCGTA